MTNDSQVKVFKLISGEEIVGAVESETDVDIKLKNVVRFVMTPEGLGMQPVLALSPNMDHTFSSSHIITSGVPADEILDGYQNAFCDIIVPTDKKLII